MRGLYLLLAPCGDAGSASALFNHSMTDHLIVNDVPNTLRCRLERCLDKRMYRLTYRATEPLKVKGHVELARATELSQIKVEQ